MATADDLLTWARAQIGVTESPAGSNRVRYWDDCGLSGYQGQPWCASFVLAGLLRVGVGPVTRSVYVPQIRKDYQKVGRLFPVAQALPGDQVLYSFGQGHTGIVESVNVAAHTVTAIEGNTSSGTAGSQDNGGGVYRRTRGWATVAGVGRPPFDPPRPQQAGVKPMFDPPLSLGPVVASRTCGTGGFWLLAQSGAVFAFEGAPYAGGANGKPYFVGRNAATFTDPNPAEVAAGKLYVILSKEAGGRYAFPETP